MATPWRRAPRSKPPYYQSKRTYTVPPEPALGLLLDKIQKSDLLEDSRKFLDSARITDCKYVASFNWVDSPQPQILVPGGPPRWTPLKQARRLQQDSGEFPRDRNGYHFPKHPFEAAIVSVLTMQPEPPRVDFSIVCSSSTLGRLVAFLHESQPPDFRAHVEVVGGVVHLFRQDKAPDELYPDIVGYGHNFADAYTSWTPDTRGSTSSQRIVRYKLGDLNVLLRGEIDGYLGEGRLPAFVSRTAGTSKPSVNNLIEGLSSSSIASKAAEPQALSVQVKQGGSVVPDSSLFDLKTRSIKKKDDDILSGQIPRLWRFQIPNSILAFHDHGTFTDIEVTNVSDRIKQWEADNADTVAQVIALLHRLIDLVWSMPDQKMEIRLAGEGRLEIREQGVLKEAFSPAVRAKWEAWLKAAAAASHEPNKCKE